MLRRGARLLEFKRQIDHKSCQFEYQDNCQIVTISKAKVLQRLVNEEFELVTSATPLAQKTDSTKNELFLDLSSLNEHERKEFDWRLAYVTGVRKRGITKGQRKRVESVIRDIAKAISDSSPPSASSVMAWLRSYERGDDNTYALITRRRLAKRESSLSKITNDLIWKGIQTIYLTRERRPISEVCTFVKATLNRMRQAGELPDENEGKIDVSQRTIYRRIKEIDPFERDRKRFGESHARNKWRYSFNTEVAIYPMQRVEMDHTQLDIYVLDDRLGILLGRPWITVLVDRHSGYLLGFYVSFAGPSIQSALGAIKAAIQPKGEIVSSISGVEHEWLAEGIAALYVLDNGLEFHSRKFLDVIQHGLRSEVIFCAVHQPWLKPAVERAIGLFNQHALPRRGHTNGLESWGDLDPTKHAAISFSELCQILVRWATDIHPFAVNDRKIARPYDLFSEGLTMAPLQPLCVEKGQLDFIAAVKKSCTVRQGGVVLERLQYCSEELGRLRPRDEPSYMTYMKFDPEDLGQVYVQDPRNENWLLVPCTRPDYANGLSLKQHKQIQRFRREKLNQRNDVDGYLEALLKFQEHIQSLLAGRPSVRTSANVAKFANFTSAKVFAGESQSILDSKATRIVAKDELTPTKRNVPSFEVRYVD